MLTGIVLTKNEATNLKRCLESLKFCSSIIVIDDDSTDNTGKIAKSMSAKVINHPLNKDYSAQRNFAISQADTPWILFIDADEVVSSKLAQEISLATKKIQYKGFYIPRIDYMWGKKLKFGDTGRTKLLRLARRGAGQWHGQVHEIWQIEGKVGHLKNPLFHHPHQTMVEFLHHINNYSTIRAQELYSQNHSTNVLEIIFYPLFKFTYLYLFKLGFLDGTPGFIHAMTMSFYSFLTRSKLWLLYK